MTKIDQKLYRNVHDRYTHKKLSSLKQLPYNLTGKCYRRPQYKSDEYQTTKSSERKQPSTGKK